MVIDFFDSGYLSEVRRTIESLTDISLSIYDGAGKLLSDSEKKDHLLSIITSNKTGRTEYNAFINDTISTAVLRKDIAISKAPSGQYHFFIPCQFDMATIVLVGGAPYMSFAEFKEFISQSPYLFPITHHRIEELSKKILVMDYKKMQDISHSVQKLFTSAIQDRHENGLFRKRYNRSKTILRLLANIEEGISQSGLYKVMSDILLFLFNIDSLALLSEDRNQYATVFSAGRFGNDLCNFFLHKNTRILSELFQKKLPVFYDDPHDVRALGVHEQIESVYLFPILSKEMPARVLCLFDTMLSSEDEEEIFELCRMFNIFSTTTSLQSVFINKMQDLTALNNATDELNLTFENPDILYDSIVSTAVRLSKAEKGSLMLADRTGTNLSVKAVHGINKWLVKDLKITSGEGIAGKVFRENMPLLSADIEKDLSVKKKPIYRTPSFMSIPLKIGKDTIGVLNISDKISGEIFQEEDLELIRYFANYATIALKGSSYYNIAEQMKELSITDPLTEIFNRRYFQDRMNEEIDRSERHNLNFSLSIIDIDDFKMFNDSEGHPAGDDILKRLSILIYKSLRSIDVLARIGGEEFAVIMPQSDREEAFLVAERIRNTIKEKLTRTWKFYPKDNITVSIGISTFPFDGTEVKKLILNADKALYRAKIHGKNRTFIWGRPVM